MLRVTVELYIVYQLKICSPEEHLCIVFSPFIAKVSHRRYRYRYAHYGDWRNVPCLRPNRYCPTRSGTRIWRACEPCTREWRPMNRRTRSPKAKRPCRWGGNHGQRPPITFNVVPETGQSCLAKPNIMTHKMQHMQYYDDTFDGVLPLCWVLVQKSVLYTSACTARYPSSAVGSSMLTVPRGEPLVRGTHTLLLRRLPRDVIVCSEDGPNDVPGI